MPELSRTNSGYRAGLARAVVARRRPAGDMIATARRERAGHGRSGATAAEGIEGEAQPPLASPLVYTRGRLAPAH